MINLNKPSLLDFEPFYHDPPAPSAGESTASMMQALTQYLPSLMQVENAQVGPTAHANLNVAKDVSLGYSQLLTDLYKQFAPQLAQSGSDVDRISRLGAANTDLAILQGPGSQLATTAQGIDKTLNPEYYATRSAEAGKLGDLLSSINLNNPNPEAERLVNQENQRSGNLTTPSNATNTVANALSFGNEQQKRRDALSQALNTATNFLQPSQGQFNPVVTALNRPTSNTGSNQFQGIPQNAGGQAYNTAGQLLSTIGGFQSQASQINANRRDALDRISQVAGSVSV